MIPRTNIKRRAKARKRRSERVEIPAHRQWVRGFECVVNNEDCLGKIECAHVRTGTDAGMGKKPSDWWTYPGCGYHHCEQHLIGETTFEEKYSVNLKAMAQKLWAKSPHRIKWERENA